MLTKNRTNISLKKTEISDDVKENEFIKLRRSFSMPQLSARKRTRYIERRNEENYFV